MIAAALASYVLMTVSADSAIHYSDPPFASEHMCLEARSLVLSGRTLEQIVADEAERKAARDRQEARDRLDTAMAAQTGKPVCRPSDGGASRCVDRDGDVDYGDRNVPISMSVMSTLSMPQTFSVRAAECVVDH